MVKVTNSVVRYGNGHHKYACMLYVDRLIIFREPCLTGSSERQLLMYSMEKESMLLLNLVSQKDSREAHNFILGYLIDYLRDYSYTHYLVTTEK